MKKKILFTPILLAIMLFYHTDAMAQNKKIALLPMLFEGSTQISASEKNLLNSVLRSSFSTSKEYEALTRTDLASILEEYNFQSSGFVDDQQRVEIGRMSGADYICLSRLTKDGLYNYLEVSLIEATSGLISSSASAVTKNERGNFMDVWEQTMRDVVSDLMRFERTTPDYLQDVVDGSALPFQLVEKKPSFFGCNANAFSEWVNERLIYPELAKEHGRQGRVMLQFTIERNGTVSEVQVLKSVDKLLDEEAIRVVSSSPTWRPGFQRDRAVKVTYTFPVIFQLR